MRQLLILSFFLVALLLPVTGNAAETSSSKESAVVELHTSKGLIVLELDAVKAPETVANFKRYVKDGFYANTIFHRVIPGFMIQGGGFTPEMKEKDTRAPIKNEANNGLPNEKYTIAMARTNDPHSASSQFFINTVNNSFLNHTAPNARGWGYAVFGRVVEGMDVVDLIERESTQTVGYFENVPVSPVIIQSANIRGK